MAQQDFSLLLSIAPDAPKPAVLASGADEFVDAIGPALTKQESGGKQLRPDGTPVTSSKGAIGMWQVMPGTAPEAARLAGIEFDDVKYRNDADYNATLGRAYLRKQFDTYQDPAKALAAYNAGPGALDRALATAEKNGQPTAWLQYLPRETQAYVPAILGRASQSAPAGSFSAARPLATDRTATQAVGDAALGAASGVVTGVKLLSDVFGADNPVSQTLDGANKALMETQSPYRQDQRAERAATIRQAENSGSTWEEIKANVGGFIEAPVETTLNALGTSAPTLLMSVLPGLGQAQAARLILQGAVGAGQGVGAAKSGIYDAVRDELIATGKYSRDDAEKVAAGAQAYDSANAGNLALNGLLGVVAGTSGIEGAASRMLNRGAGQAAARGIAGRAGMGVVKESPVEGAQGGFERYTSNVALQNEGFNVDPMRGVVGQAAGEAIASAPGGALFGALDRGLPPALQPVADKAAELNSPLSRAAMAGNAGALSGAAVAPGGIVSPANGATGAPSGGTIIPPAGYGPAADDLVQRVRNLEEGMRNEGWLDNLRADGLDSRDVMLDLALARNTNAPRAAREAALERVESATYFANRDAPPAAPLDSIAGNPDFDFITPQPEPRAPREVPSLAAVASALTDPGLRRQISDPDRDQLLYLYNLARNSEGEQTVRVNAAQQALEIVGRYQAPTSTPRAQSTPALEQAAPAPAGLAAPDVQQNVGESPQELDFLTTAPAPKQPRGPLGGDADTPAFLRKRANVVRQLVDNGFETVARDGSTFFLTNTKTGQKFELEGPADAQLARKAIKDRVDAIANTAAASPKNDLTAPTEAQIAAGNYKKSDVIELNGMRIKIENPQGSTRRGTSPDGKAWETKMAHHYGEFQGTVGADGDKLDVFVGPRPDSSKVFVIDQRNADGSFDEHKVMLGFTSPDAAQQGYLANYEPGWTGLGAITEMSVDQFKTWSKSRAAKKPAATAMPATAPSAATGTATPAVPAVPSVPAPDLSRLTSEWDQRNRRSRSEAWFDGAKVESAAVAGFSAALQNGGAQLPAHGMAKESTLSGAVQNLLGLLQNGLDPSRRGGRLDYAPLVTASGSAQAAVSTTPGGSAYSDGPFMLVARPGQEFTGKLEGLGAILVNESHPEIVPALRAAVQAIRPDIVVDTYGNAGEVAKQLTLPQAATPVPGAAVEAAIATPNANFTAAEQAESAALGANQPQFLNVNDGGKQRKLRLIKAAELPKTASAPRPGEPRPLAQTEAKLIERIASLLGKSAVFYKAEGGRLADGFVYAGQPNTIFVASETTINPLAVFGHEFFHTLRDTNPEAWNAIAAVVRSKVTNAKGFRADRYGSTAAEERGDAALSEEAGGELEELVSDLGGNLLKDSKFWAEVFAKINEQNGPEAKSIIAKLSAALQRLITRIVNAMQQPGYQADGFVKDLDQVRAAFRAAMADYMKGAGIGQVAMAAEQKRAEQQVKKSEDRPPGLTVTGYHFSPQARPTLSTAFFGTGLKGSAREEILSSADGRIRQRLSFYYDKGTGVRPEAGVGGIAHKATLTNIYDADRDPLKLKGGNARAFESKVVDAGYNGYLARLEGTQPGQVILLGNQTVTPEVLGPRSRIGGDETGVEAAAPVAAPVKKGLMSRELNELNVDAIPGATLRAGMLTVPPDAVAQANAELERIGSPVRFSPDREDVERAQREYAAVEAQYKGTEQWLKAPNGKPTNLAERQWVQVRTPAFKSWFGDWEAFAAQTGGIWNDGQAMVSKVVDANGEPLVVYHGASKGGFMTFKEPGGTKRGDLGIFATANEGMAESYVRRNRARRVEAPKPAEEQTGWRYIDAATGRTLFTMRIGDDAETRAVREKTNKAKAVPMYGDDPRAGDQPGIYALFLNIRNPNDAFFEGANWDGTRYEQYQVINAAGEPVYSPDGRAVLPEHEAQALADRNDGAQVEKAPDHSQSTDGVVREARRNNNDGAIIHDVMDDGGGPGYNGEPADIFVALAPNQVKSADFNNGVFSVNLDDIRFSAERGAILDAAEGIRFSRARTDRKIDPRHVPEFKFKDFVGRFLFATIADRTAAGGAFTGIDGAGANAVPLQGGPGFPLLSRNFNKAVIWANEGPAVAGRKKNIIEQYGNPLMAVSLGELDMHKSNATAVLAYLYTLENYIAKGRVQLDALEGVSQTIRGLKLAKDVNENELASFPGFRDRKQLHAFIDGATFDARAAIVQELGKARSEEIGLPSADKVIRKLTDPEYAGARHFDTVLILEPATEETFVKLGDEGTDRHLSYSYALKGKVVGKLRVPVNAREIWSDWWSTQYAKKWDEKQRFQDAYNSGDASKLSKEEFKQFEKNVNNEKKLASLVAGDFDALISMDRAFALSMPVVQITPDLAARLDALTAADAPNAATARAAVAFMNDDWATSDSAKNKGGTSPANFARELRQSDAAATLDLHNEQDLVDATRGWKWSEAGGKRIKEPVSKMRLFQLRGQRIQFALKYGAPYTYGVTIPGLSDDQVTLTSVVNNEAGVNGIGGPAIMLKAIAEGATFLDAYAVKSERFPGGFLPTLYNEYGFEEVARVPADPQYITDDHRYAWSQNGWKEGDALPDIVMMQWKGSDEQRTGLLERYLGEGAASLRRSEVGASARGLARELAGQGDAAQRAEPGADRGARGDQGAGDRASLASRAFKAVAQLRALTDAQLRNLGVDPQQVRNQPPESTVRLSADRLTSVDRIKWRNLQDVKSEIALDALPAHIAPFGDFMKYMARKAAVGAISPRDILKAYTITRSSVNRGAISTAKAISGGLQLPADFNEPTVRPEGAFAYWLLSPAGQDYLNDAELGIVNQAAIDDAVAAMAPFGMANTLGDDMVRAVDDDIGSLGLQVSYIVNKAHAGTDMVSDWQRVLDDLYGIGYAKKGFMGAMLGYGQLPTFDARQINVQVEADSRKDVLNALTTKRAAEVVETLSRRLDALELTMDEEYLPFKQHLVHHAVWDAVGKSETTHSDVVDAMLRASADRKPAPETTVDEVPPAQAKGRQVTYEVEVEDTGETARLTVDAADALTDYDERIATAKKLLECLNK